MVYRKTRVFRGRSEKQTLNGNVATSKPVVPGGWSVTDNGAGGGGGGSPTPWTSDIDAAGFNITNLGTVNGVKVYRALLTQSGTDAPVANIKEDTIGEPVIWTFISDGRFRAQASIFDRTTTWWSLNPNGVGVGTTPYPVSIDISTGALDIFVGSADDPSFNSQLIATPLLILVFPA